MTAKVHGISSTEKITKAVISVSDETDYTDLTIWNEQINNVTTGASYKFINSTVRIFQDEMSITTNPATKIIQVDDRQSCWYPQKTRRHCQD